MTRAVLIHIEIETIGVLDRSNSLLFLWVVLIDYFVFKVSSLSLVLKNKAECQVCHSCNKDAIMCELQKAIKLQRCSQTSWCHSDCESGKSMTFEIAQYVFALNTV